MFHIDAKFACVACDKAIYNMLSQMRMPVCREILCGFELQYSQDVESLPTEEALAALAEVILKAYNEKSSSLHLLSCQFDGYSHVKQIEVVSE